MKEYREKNSISGIAALLLLGVFAVGILAVLLTGAGAYKRATDQSAASYDMRTCSQYISNKIRQAPASDAVVLSDFGDGDSLLIREQIGGDEYWTQVYCHNGWLMELFAVANADFGPEDGERILPAQSLSATADDNLLRVRIRYDEDSEETLWLTLRGERQGSHEK